MKKRFLKNATTCLAELVATQIRQGISIEDLKMNINEAMQELALAKERMDKVIVEQTATLARIADLESSLAAREIQLTPAEEQLVADIKNGLTEMDERIPDAEPQPDLQPEPEPVADADPVPAEEQVQ